MTDEAPPPRIEFYSRKRRGHAERIYRFRIRAANGQIVAQGNTRGYSRKIDRDMTAAHLRDGLINARFYDLDDGGKEVE